MKDRWEKDEQAKKRRAAIEHALMVEDARQSIAKKKAAKEGVRTKGGVWIAPR